MPAHPIVLQSANPQIVGSFGDLDSLLSADPKAVQRSCDIAEIRLDLIGYGSGSSSDRPWSHLEDVPLLFTARRGSEGGAGELSASDRIAMLRSVLDDASLIDLEVASIPEMQQLVDELNQSSTPWIASFHDFCGTPSTDTLSAQRQAARNAGASAFKAAVELGWHTDQLAPLGLFIRQVAGYPVSLMGMGPLAPVSRVLFGQLGSVLNYGYLGETPTAPGQWSARQLKEALNASRVADDDSEVSR